MRKLLSKLAISSLLLAAMVSISGCNKNTPPAAAAPEKISLQLHWIADSHQLGFWLAMDKGFYVENGLDVTVRPGGMDANPIKDALSGAADIGQVGGIEQVCTAVTEKLPLKAIASIHRETPHALISLAEHPIREPADFAGKTIAVAYGDTAEVLLKSYLAKNKIPVDSVKLVPFKYDLTPLISGQVDAVTGFSSGQPATLEKLGKRPVVLSYASGGISSYGYTLVASDATLNKRGEAVARFLKASRQGWEYAFAHPDEAVSLFKKRFGDAVDEKLARRELELIRPLMTTTDGKLSTWKLDAARVESVIQFLVEQGQIKSPAAASAVFDNSLVE